MSVSQSVMSPLRSARLKMGLTIEEVAERTAISPSYISKVETNQRAATNRFLVAYARALGQPDEAFFGQFGKTAPAEPGSIEFLEIFKSFEPIGAATRPTAIDGRKQRQQLAASPEARVSSMFREALANTDPRTLASIRYSRSQYKQLDADILNEFGPSCLSRKIPLRVLFRSAARDPNPQEAVADLAYILRMQLPFIADYDDLVTFESVENLQNGIYPMDMHLALPGSGLLCFGSQPLSAEHCAKLVIEDAGPLGERLASLRNYRDRTVQLFRHREFMKFAIEQSSLIAKRDRSYLAQRFLGGCSRPPSDFREGTSWYQHYSSLKDRGEIDMSQLVDLRLQISYQSRLKNMDGGMRQICSRSAVETWAEKGTAVDKPKDSRSIDSMTDRLGRIDYLRFLVESSTNFEVAAADDDVGKELGWASDPAERDVSWSVEGQAGVIIETTCLPPSEGARQEVQCVIQSEQAASEFASHFDRVWDRISPRVKDKRNVLQWIAHVRVLIEQAG